MRSAYGKPQSPMVSLELENMQCVDIITMGLRDVSRRVWSLIPVKLSYGERQLPDTFKATSLNCTVTVV
ncbi:hypothetical protein TNCV_3749921 [Trichonephila clavipes]|nr:hypothetical protein TNCV_3749921 [Trichonephila clavipes]